MNVIAKQSMDLRRGRVRRPDKTSFARGQQGKTGFIDVVNVGGSKETSCVHVCYLNSQFCSETSEIAHSTVEGPPGLRCIGFEASNLLNPPVF